MTDPLPSNPVQSNPTQSNPTQSNPTRAIRPRAIRRRAFGPRRFGCRSMRRLSRPARWRRALHDRSGAAPSGQLHEVEMSIWCRSGDGSRKGPPIRRRVPRLLPVAPRPRAVDLFGNRCVSRVWSTSSASTSTMLLTTRCQSAEDAGRRDDSRSDLLRPSRMARTEQSPVCSGVRSAWRRAVRRFSYA